MWGRVGGESHLWVSMWTHACRGQRTIWCCFSGVIHSVCVCTCPCLCFPLCVISFQKSVSYYTSELQGSVCVCPCALGLEMSPKNSWICLYVHLRSRVTDPCNNIWMFYMTAGIRPQLLMLCGPHFTSQLSPDLTASVFCFIFCWCLSFLFPTLPFHLLVCVACSFDFLLCL